jgi:hypothetical protein
MDNVSKIYNLFKTKTPFCFIKINDGECIAMDNPTPVYGIISRGDDVSSEQLSECLKNALNYTGLNYFVGLPCKVCRNKDYNVAMKYYKNPPNPVESNLLCANILINSNTYSTFDVFQEYAHTRSIIIVSNEKNLTNIANIERFNIKPYRVIKVAEQYAFQTNYEELKEAYKTFNNGDTILCLCGPLGRVLCYEWYKNNNTLTCLELGSIFDPYLRNRSHSYHTMTHAPCVGCFQEKYIPSCHTAMIEEIIQNPRIINECVYSYSDNSDNNETLEVYMNYFRKNVDMVRRNARIRLKKNIHDTAMKEILFELDMTTTQPTLYNSLTKPSVYQLASRLYYTHNYVACNNMCDYYIKTFLWSPSPPSPPSPLGLELEENNNEKNEKKEKKEKDKCDRLILFFYAFTMPTVELKKDNYIKLLKEPNLEDDIRGWCAYNMTHL